MLYLLKTLFVIELLMAIGLALFRWALATPYRNVVSGNVIALALATPVVALFCGNIYLFCIYLVAAIAFNSRSRAELAGSFVFLLPLMPYLSVESGVGSLYLFAISPVLAMGLGALIGFAVTQNRRSLTLLRYDLAALSLAGIFIYITNRDPSVTGLLRGLTINTLNFGGPYLLVSRSIRSVEDVQKLLLRFCLGGTVMAVTAIFEAKKHWVLFQIYYQSLHVPFPLGSAAPSMRAGLLRTGGAIMNYSAGGLFLACVLTLMPFVRPSFQRAGFWIVSVTLTAALFASQSRGAWVAAIVGFLFIQAYRGRWSLVAMAAGVVTLAETAILVFAKFGTLAAMTGQTEETSGTVTYRTQLAARGMDQIRAHPLFGQSSDQLVGNMAEMMQGEHIVDFVNAHLFVAMAAGVPLFLVWCWVWAMPVIEGWRRRRSGQNNLAGAPAAIIVPAIVALTFTSTADRIMMWPTIALGLAGPCLMLARRDGFRRQTTSELPASPPPVGRHALPLA